jgi:hypothetical protein
MIIPPVKGNAKDKNYVFKKIIKMERINKEKLEKEFKEGKLY